MSDQQGTCPLEGLWYTCTAQSPTFFGCCASDPCNGVGCPTSDLRAAGMGTGSGPNLAVNDSSFWPNVHCSNGSWWTCALQTPTFQGCCGSDPCGGKGCPSSSLYPAAFATIPASLAPAAASTSLSSLSSTSSSSASSSSTGPSSVSSQPTAQPAITISNSSPPTNVGAIAGGVAGGALFVILLGIIFYLLWRLHKRRHSVGREPEFSDDNIYSKLPTNTTSQPLTLDIESAFQGAPKANGQMNSSNTPHAIPLPSPSYTNQTSLTPRSPAPPYDTEVHELPTSTAASNGGGHDGLGLVNLETLQEAEAQGDTPNPYPVQKQWSAKRRSELPDTATRRADGHAGNYSVAEAGGSEDPQRRRQGWDSYNN
jgi:hypothetical protein